MPHDTILIATVAAGLGVAFVFGLLAVRLKLPPTVGYLVAGVVLGPFTPGYVADAGLASQLAEMGVILLMFGVGLHFSLADLAAVRRVVVPGALMQVVLTGTLGGVLGHLWGLGWGGAVVLGLSLGVASTAVLLKSLEGRDRLDSPEGRLAVGWLVVEDVTMVLALVLLPALAPMLGGAATDGTVADSGSVPLALGIATAKVALFVALVFFVGRRVVPWLLEHVAKLGSRELFTLAVLGTALGVGTIAANLFGVSFALGAFFAGAVINESELSHRAATEALPMQDAFAVLFFVSVGMLFDPSVLTEHPFRLIALVAVIVIWKSAVSYALVRSLGENPRTALLIGTSLGQIGEFSFIVAAIGVSLGIVTRDVQALIVAAAIIAISVNGGAVRIAVRLAQGSTDRASTSAAEAAAASRAQRVEREQIATDTGTAETYDFSELAGHVVLIGYGRVGATVAEALTRAATAFVVVEEQERIVGGLRKRGERAILGDATRADVLDRAGIHGARLLLVTAPEPFRAHRIVEVAREANPSINVAVRTHSAAEQAHFEKFLLGPGATGRAVYAEREAALSLAHYALVSLGRTDDEADWVITALRGLPTAPTETFRSMLTQELRTPR